MQNCSKNCGKSFLFGRFSTTNKGLINRKEKEPQMILKLMTSNIWADVFGNPVNGRDAALVELLSKYAPDVVFLQEAHPHWHESETLKKGLQKLGYRTSIPDLGSNVLNYTPVLFKADRFAEKENLFFLYSGPNDYTSKSVSGVKLLDTESGFCFAAFSTHFYFAQNDEGNTARCSNARELISCFDKLAPGTAAEFCGGDYNCPLYSPPFDTLRNAGIETASLLAEKKINFVRTHHSDPHFDTETGLYSAAAFSREKNEDSIDHITVRGNKTAVKEYRVIIDREALILSDHCPVLITTEISQ